MVKVQARGLHLDADGLGVTLRVNGVVTAPVPVVTLDVNNSFKTVTCTADGIITHPTGSYTDVHYVLGEEVLGIDVALATGITNAPEFQDVLVGNSRDGGNKGADYDYGIIVGSDGTEFGCKASGYGSVVKNVNGSKLKNVVVNGADGSMAVNFADDSRPCVAVTVAFEGLVVPDLDQADGEALTIRLDWSVGNSRYEVGTSASMVAVGEYLTLVEGAYLGVTVAQIN